MDNKAVEKRMDQMEYHQSGLARYKTLRLMMAGVPGALICLLIVSFTVLEHIPRDRYLIKTLRFSRGPELNKEQARSQWPLFARAQKLELRKQALSLWPPSLTRQLDIAYRSDPYQLILSFHALPMPGDQDEQEREIVRDIDERFTNLIETYVRQRRWLSDRAGAMRSEPSSGEIQDKLADDIAEYNRLEAELIRLQNEYNRLAASSIALKQEINPKKPRETSRHFQEFAAENLETVYREDEPLQALREKVKELETEIQSVDMALGRCESQVELEELELRGDRLRQEMQDHKIKRQQRREELEKDVENRLWPLYQQHLKARIRRLDEQMRANSDRQLEIKQQEHVLVERIELMRSILPPENGSGGVSEMETIAALPFRLENADEPSREQYRFSLMQTLLLALSALVGGGLGIIAAEATTKLTNKPRRESEPLIETEAAKVQPSTPQKPVSEKIAHPAESQPDRSTKPVPPVRAETRRPAQPEPKRAEPEKAKPKSEPAAQPQKAQRAIPFFSRKKKEKQTQASQTDWTEQYNVLARKIQEMARQVAHPLILISTNDPAVTTPRSAVNLAIALSRDGSGKILLIEADLQKDDLAQVFETNGAPGYFEWRRGELWLSKVVNETSLPGLNFMPTGEPAAQQCSKKTDISREAHRWGNLRKNYDVVLIYCPDALSPSPETPEQLASAPLLDIADGLVVQIADKQNPDEAASLTGQRIRNHKARFVDIVKLAKK